ncbi:MAG TPA: YvcK family protein, partial [Candidatus Microbacterium pullistercoris]|nr:YvcK family protein [Candidatus Microbacterium pullistercoris]
RRLGSRWPLGATLHPATDAEIDTQVVTDSGRMHFQEWWVRHRSRLPARRFKQSDIERASVTSGARDAIENADVILVAPSNPVVSIGPVLAVPGMRGLLRDAAAPIVGVSGIIDGSVVRGMADACLTAIGVETSARAVAEHYGARRAGGILDGWLVDETDASATDPLTALGITTRAVPLWMRDPDSSAQVARDTLALARTLR